MNSKVSIIIIIAIIYRSGAVVKNDTGTIHYSSHGSYPVICFLACRVNSK